MSLKESEVIRSWESNAVPWAEAVRENKIASRTALTNRAILDTVGPGRERAGLDLGCGEGWLSRAMSELGWRVVGIDGSQALIQTARSAGDEEYRCLDYSRLRFELPKNTFHLVVCNFSLLGEESTRQAVVAASVVLRPGGRLVIQTVHPLLVTGPYTRGWRTEDWSGFADLACEPSPWFYHTLSDWSRLLLETGFVIQEIREPRLENANSPLSLILVAQRAWMPLE